ncbi:FK506-binding protein 5 isoform X2 [Echeneis naucrates]|uniref:FK506-binding protein 5 isoform X2 n=1 Tax=Echeneis naucrates TaxID=173247 RepID=UPI001114388F|nr:FK506-binding protein 5-like isoform X2 [Echeneis naucrates]
MEPFFSDQLSDEFFDLDFENLTSDEKDEEEKEGNAHENLPTNKDQEATAEATALSSKEPKELYMAENVELEQLDHSDDDEEEKEGNPHENLPTNKDHEATAEATALSSKEPKELYMAENVELEQLDNSDDDDDEEEDFQGIGVSVMNTCTAPGEDYTSPDGEGSVSREDGEDEESDVSAGKQGDLLGSVFCYKKVYCGNKEDRIFAKGQPSSLVDAEKLQVRNEDRGESESDQEASYFGRIPERGDEMMVKGDGVERDEKGREEDKQEDSSDCAGMKVEQEEDVLALCVELEVEHPYRGEPATATLDFPEILVQNLQLLIDEVDMEEYGEKMKDFSGEEHQEAGESFADYPSDFSSCEYVDNEAKNQESKTQPNAMPHTSKSSSITKQEIFPDGEVTDQARDEDTSEEGDEYLYSGDLEMNAEWFSSFDVAAGEQDRRKCEYVWSDAVVRGCDDEGEMSQDDSYSSSDDDFHWTFATVLDKLNEQDFDDHHISNDRAHPSHPNKGFVFDVSKIASIVSEDLLTPEDTDTAELPVSDVSQHPAEDMDNVSVVQRDDSKTTSPLFQGSLDDNFFFNTELEASEAAELGQLLSHPDDELELKKREEERKERIEAFDKFYNDSDGVNEREARQIKVQFGTDPVSEVFNFEPDCERKDPSSAETPKELPDWNQKTPCLDLLKLMLKMGLVTVMGLLMFWMGSGQPDWLSLESFFNG